MNARIKSQVNQYSNPFFWEIVRKRSSAPEMGFLFAFFFHSFSSSSFLTYIFRTNKNSEKKENGNNVVTLETNVVVFVFHFVFSLSNLLLPREYKNRRRKFSTSMFIVIFSILIFLSMDKRFPYSSAVLFSPAKSTGRYTHTFSVARFILVNYIFDSGILNFKVTLYKTEVYFSSSKHERHFMAV